MKNRGLIYTAKHVYISEERLKAVIKNYKMALVQTDGSPCSEFAKNIVAVISNILYSGMLHLGADRELSFMLTASAAADLVNNIGLLAPLERYSNEIIQVNRMQNFYSCIQLSPLM